MRERREQGRNETPSSRGLVYICGVGGVLSDRDSKVRGKPQRQLDHMTLPRDWSPQEFFELRAASDFTGPRLISLLLTRNNDRIGPRKPVQLFLARHWALAEDRDASRRVNYGACDRVSRRPDRRISLQTSPPLFSSSHCSHSVIAACLYTH